MSKIFSSQYTIQNNNQPGSEVCFYHTVSISLHKVHQSGLFSASVSSIYYCYVMYYYY